MTAAIDLQVARRRSPSLDKLCREIEIRAGAVGNLGPGTLE